MRLSQWFRSLNARLTPTHGRPTPHRKIFRPRVEGLEDRTTPAGGLLDPTFGTGGIVLTNAGANEGITSVSIQPNGTFLASGFANSNFAVARYSSAGALDATFGAGGLASIDFSGYNDRADAVAVQPGTGGKILVAGSAYARRTSWDFAVVRLNPNGTVDTTFGGGKKPTGKVTLDLGSSERACGMAVLPDGKVILVGLKSSSEGSSVGQLSLVRLNANGTLDTTFGNGGKVVTSIGGWMDAIDNLARETAIAVDGSGRLVVATSTNTSSAPSREDFLVARFLANGQFDASFGQAGVAAVDVASGSSDNLGGMALQPDGKILLTGAVDGELLPRPGLTHLVVARLNANGSLDTTFGTGGTVVAGDDIPQPFSWQGTGVVAQADGKVLLGGVGGYGEDPEPPASNRILLLRLNADGSRDATYGSLPGGGVLTRVGENALVGTMALQADGRVIVAGKQVEGNDRYFLLARYLPSGPQVISAEANPDPAPAGTDVTLAAGVAAGNPGTLGAVVQVAFYADSNDDGVLDPATDLLLGYATYDSDSGEWRLTSTTAGWAPGSYRLFARARDGYGADSDPFAFTLDLI